MKSLVCIDACMRKNCQESAELPSQFFLVI